MSFQTDPFLKNIASLKQILSSPVNKSQGNVRRESTGSYSSNHRFFERERKELLAKLKDAEQAVEKEKSLRDTLEKSFETLTMHRKELTRQLAESSSTIAALEATVKMHEQDILSQQEGFELERKAFEEEKAEIEKEVGDGKNSLDSLSARLDASELKKNDFERKLTEAGQSARDERSRYDAIVEDLKIQLRTLEKDKKDLANDLAKANSNVAILHDTTKQQVDSIKQEKTAVQDELQRSQTELKENQSKLNEVQSTLNAATLKLEMEAKKSDATISALEQEVEELRVEINRVSTLLAESKKAQQGDADSALDSNKHPAMKDLEEKLARQTVLLESLKKLKKVQDKKISAMETESKQLKESLEAVATDGENKRKTDDDSSGPAKKPKGDEKKANIFMI